MKLCVYGAGAIGGLLGARLAQKGEVDVTFIARGPHLAAMQASGVRLRQRRRRDHRAPALRRLRRGGGAAGLRAGDAQGAFAARGGAADAAAAGAGDGHRLGGERHSVVVLLQAGRALGGPARWRAWTRAAKLWDTLHPSRAIGCIVYPAAEVTAPGVIEHSYGDRFSLGEPDGSRSERANALSAALVAAGFKAPVRPRIRDEMWVKLWGNLAFNPLSALTGATLDVITGEGELRAVCRAMMLEAQAVARAARRALRDRRGQAHRRRRRGGRAPHLHVAGSGARAADGDRRAARRGGGARRRWWSMPAPTCRTVLALLRGRARVAGCY